jgi:hypothetical protein
VTESGGGKTISRKGPILEIDRPFVECWLSCEFRGEGVNTYKIV